ncbi:MAG: ADP-glyceromanno-heptose 6-epimerase [Verrucomicrobia bacterium]|jgi:ADP-L-glycero-D-manno-heptose 6-epimerase|nr:MAG: ADP-glyceromanno-heptose 6-epimerase [Verrucomicrobiota bacterium]
MHSEIIVTGGAGFIGSALVHALNQQGEHKILVTDALLDLQKQAHLEPLKYSQYLSAEELLYELKNNGDSLRDIKTIFHLGACSSTTETNRDYLMKNNFEYTKTLAHWALKRDVRFVYASSAATYGDGSAGMRDEIEDLDQLHPLNLYGESKHLFDLYAREHGWLDRIVGLKYFNVFGPNEDHKQEMRSLVCKAYEQIRDTGKMALFKSYLPEYGDGKQERDFIYVCDAVKMTLHLAKTQHAHGLFNIGSGVARSWLDLAHALFTALNRKPEIDFIEMPEKIRNQYQYHTCADITRLRATGYQEPILSLEESVEDYVCNYLLTGKHFGE